MAKTDSARGSATIGVFAYERCSAWLTAGLLELFGTANIALSSLPPAARKVTRIECHLLGRKPRIDASQGVSFATRAPARRYDAVIVPSIWGGSRVDFFERLERLDAEHEPLCRLAARTRIMASACSGAVLLAGAGLLDGHRATTCWWLADWFANRYARVALALDRLVVMDRERWTAAAGSAYMHLGLDLVRALAGERAAAGSARLMLVEPRRGSQSPFLAPALLEPADEDVRRALRYLDEHTAAPFTIAAMCRAIAVHERTLARKFQAATGTSPLSYLQSRRIARARQLLEMSALTLEQIVGQCGYEDVSSFRKLFTRRVGMTPREYRSRFVPGVSRRRPARR
jgi:transcriptional regulator GlxA family with amidase domain